MTDIFLPCEDAMPRLRGGSFWGSAWMFITGGGFNWRHELVASVGEYLGTTIFLMLALGGTNVALQEATSVTGKVKDGSQTFNTSNLLMISLAFGASLAATVWMFFRISGGLFNPAVTWAFMLIGAVSPMRGVFLFIVQLMGGLTGAALADVLTPGKLHAEVTLLPGVNHARGFFIEFFMTAILVFAIIMLAVEKNAATPVAAIGIGLTMFACEMFSVYWTGGALNPARQLGPATVNHYFPGYTWIYWIGPLTGAMLSVAIYWLLILLHYKEVMGPAHHEDMEAAFQRMEQLLSEQE